METIIAQPSNLQVPNILVDLSLIKEVVCHLYCEDDQQGITPLE
jgi:hypothetical protein